MMQRLAKYVIVLGIVMIALSFMVLNQPMAGSDTNPLFAPALSLAVMVTILGALLTFLLAYFRRQREDNLTEE